MFQFVYLLSRLLPSLVPPQIPSFLPPLSLFLFAIIKQYYDEHLAALLTFSSILWWSWSWSSGSKMCKSSWFVLRVAFLESSLIAQWLGFWVFSDGPGFNRWLGNWDPASCMTQPKKQDKTGMASQKIQWSWTVSHQWWMKIFLPLYLCQYWHCISVNLYQFDRLF